MAAVGAVAMSWLLWAAPTSHLWRLYGRIQNDMWLWDKLLGQPGVTMADAVHEYAGWQADLGWSADLLERDITWWSPLGVGGHLMHQEWLVWAMKQRYLRGQW